MAARTVAGVKRLPKIRGGDVGMAARTVVGVKRLPELRGEVIRHHDRRRDSATL